MKQLAFAFVFVLCSCQAPASPTPLPTSTPIPGYVAGEESRAWESFVDYLHDGELSDCMDFGSGTPNADWSIEPADEQGSAVYVGDGIWRFHIALMRVEMWVGTVGEPVEQTYVAQSLPDRTWSDTCAEPVDPNDYDASDFVGGAP